MRGKRWIAIAAAAVAVACAAPVAGAGAAGYPRPKGASPLREPLIPVFERCLDGGRIPNSTHGAPLSSPSCSPPELISGTLTIGTPDANNKQANATGHVQYSVIPGNPSTPANEADVAIDMILTDVRRQDTLGDYTGELVFSVESKLVDMSNGPSQNLPGTSETFFFTAPIPCTATADSSVGSTCQLHTTANSVIPNMIKEGKRTIWDHVDHTHIFDGGTDGLASTEDDNLLFATQGVYVP